MVVKGVSACEEGEGECQEAVTQYINQLEEVVRYSLPKGKSVAGKEKKELGLGKKNGIETTL